jgi:hypothetical protein
LSSGLHRDPVIRAVSLYCGYEYPLAALHF